MAHAFALTYTYQDDAGKTATHDIHVPTAFSIAQFTEFGRSMADLLDNIVSGLITSVDLTLTADLSGLLLNFVEPEGDVEEVASFQFATADNRSVEINLPAINEDVVLAGSNDIDQTDAGIAAFITAMESGIAVTGGTIQPCDVNQDSIVDTVYAREAFRSSGKRR